MINDLCKLKAPTKGMMYKGYLGSANLEIDQGIIHGKIIGIDDLVTYESDSIDGIREEFKAAVDDYLETCEEVEKTPQVTKPNPEINNERKKILF